MKKNIVCFYWQGDRWGEQQQQTSDVSFARHFARVGPASKDLASKYVNNLYDGVRRFTTEEFNFICFTNEALQLNEGIETRPFKLITNKGVLPRMYMFSKEAGLFGSQVLSLDIDLIITGSLNDLVNYNGLFCTRMSWTKGEEHLRDGDIMSFRAGEETEEIFWNPLVRNTAEVEKLSQGRERVWVRHVIKSKAEVWQDVTPGQVCSYKFHVQQTRQLPENARIVSCHGYPRPHQIKDEWRKEYWK